MSLPSAAKDTTSHKISLVRRPSVTFIQAAQVIGTTSQSQPTLIYVQSVQPPITQQQHHQHPKPTLIAPKSSSSFSQPTTTISKRAVRPPTTTNKIDSLPSTSYVYQSSTNRVYTTITAPNRSQLSTATPNRVKTLHFKSNVTNAQTAPNQPPVQQQLVNAPRTAVTEKAPATRITKYRPILAAPANTKPPNKSSATAERPASVATATNHKAIAPNVTKVDSVKNRYRTILENLLQLKNNFVRRTITQAIQQRLCNQSNEDLLNVIFRSFELTLLSVNVEQISLNETYLNATLAFLAKVIDTGRFMELIGNRKETKDITKFVTSEMSTILNKVSLESVYKNAREVFEQKQRSQYALILELLNKVIGLVDVQPDTKMSSTEIEFWLKDVAPLVFDSDDDIQSNAIDAISKAVPLLLASQHQSHPYWQQLRSIIISDYTQKISACFRQGSPKWHMAWCIFVRLLDVDIPRSASTLNAFLSIVEPALRSNVPLRRAEGYLCWRVLLEVLVRHNRLNSEKRLKLMCTPLKSLQAKTFEIARNKFQAWWYVLCNVQQDVENYTSMVFEPFLQFSFGQLFAAPNIQLTPGETATQVKSFPTVSLMAVCALLRMLDECDKQLDELFAKFSLIQPSHAILTETIFSMSTTAALLINACGEATVMLCNFKNDANNNTDCTTLAVCLWTRLFKHVNQAKNTEHISLILDNVSQLMKIGHDTLNASRMIPLVCATVLDQVSASFVFEPSADGQITDEVSRTVAKLMNVLVRDSKASLSFENALSYLLAVPSSIDNFYRNFSNFLTIIDEQFFKRNGNSDENSAQCCDRALMCCQFISCILTYIQLNAESFAATRPNTDHIRIPPVFFSIIYWPLSFSLSKENFDVYTKTLLKSIDILLTMINKSDFCKESAKIVKNIIAKPKHCTYINDAIAMLFDYMVYDFDDLKEAPIEMLNLCVLVIKKDSKVQFQDLNSIARALIKYRRAISKKQFGMIAPKLREVVKLIENEKSNMRTEANLIKDLKDLMSEESIIEKPSPQGNKSLRSARGGRTDKDEFVVVNKVWKLEPSKLTEHQKEKMKTRRCDIPALYNDLSQSQDSVSIQEWSSQKSSTKALNNSKTEHNDVNVAASDTQIEAVSESPASQRSKRNDKGSKVSPKRLSANQNESAVDSESTDEGNHPKRRMTRELNRIQNDSKSEDVPHSLPESNRQTRSTVKKIEDKPDVKRKTRSTDTPKASEAKEVKKKVTRASPANSPLPKKQKSTRASEKTTPNASDADSSSEPTPKRRLTRQSKTEESDQDESLDEKKVDIKEENSKTEFVDTLELKVEKLPMDLMTSVEKSEKDDKNGDDVVVAVRSKSDLMAAQTETKPESSQMDVDEKESIKMDVDEEVDEKVDTAVSQNVVPTKLTDAEAEAARNAEILVETATVSDGSGANPGDATKQTAEEAQPAASQSDNNSDNENEITSRSYMSALVFDGISPSRSLNGSTIVTSPEIDAPRSLEFLSDTLNISPIASDGNAKKEGHSNEQAKKSVGGDDMEGIEKMDDPVAEAKRDTGIEADKQIVGNEVVAEKHSAQDSKRGQENEVSKNAAIAASVLESPAGPPAKQPKLSLAMQSSTPLQSHQSPVSSKFKTQLVGRGAQLLKMINSNKSPKPASPTPATMIESAFKTASPTINQLETAPICENIVQTPEPKSSRDKNSERHEQNENGNYLTLSKPLPSPYESPGISILKRKSSNISMDDSMHSPAPKRKRVSFGFPLTHTKEFVIDDDFTPFYVIPSHDSPCRRVNRMKKLKLKRNKYQNNDSAKTKANDNKRVRIDVNDIIDTNEAVEPPPIAHKDEEVSVKHIQEYLGMDMDAYRAKQEKQLAEQEASTASAASSASIASTAPTVESSARDLNSDDSSTESNDEAEVVLAPPTAKTIAEFSDDAIFAHLLSKYTPNDILKKFDKSIDATVLTKRLSAMMSNNKQVEAVVLEELAEKHSESFLEHAITENLCSVICDRLSSKSSSGINDYFADKINGDEQFASDFLDRISVSVLRQKLMDIATTSKREQHILLEDFLVALKDYISSTRRGPSRGLDTGILPEHVHLWVSKLFDQFKLTAEQYLQLTSIYIQKNPPAALDHFN